MPCGLGAMLCLSLAPFIKNKRKMNKSKIYITTAIVLSMLFVGMSYTIGAEIGKDKLPSFYDGEGFDNGSPETNEKRKIDVAVKAKEVAVEVTKIPSAFRGMNENALIGSEFLDSTFNEIASKDKVVRILQIGDSHVRGYHFPLAVRETLEKAFGSEATGEDKITYKTDCIASETGKPGIVYSAIGINGACVSRFTKDDMIEQIADQHPDMVIISFGTNESCGNYSEESHSESLEILMDRIKAVCPGVTFLLTTPPGSYASKRIKKSRRRTSAANENTIRVAKNIVKFGHEHNAAVWDMYGIAGGDEYACLNWKTAGLMNRDLIHYTVNGYKLQGHLLGEAILKAYNKYVRN